MKLVLTAPNQESPLGNSHGFDATRLFKKWLSSAHRIHVGEHARIEWNDVHEFWDLHLYEIPGNPGAPKSHWSQVEEVLDEEGYDYKRQGPSWKWVGKGEDKKQLDGHRLWIQPKTLDT